MRQRRSWHPRVDDGSGSILTVAVVGAIVMLTLMMLPLYMVFSARHSVAAAADAAALAAADTAVGIVAGFPCESAERVAAANGAAVASCDVDGLVVTVTATGVLMGLPVTATATAGPAGSGTD